MTRDHFRNSTKVVRKSPLSTNKWRERRSHVRPSLHLAETEKIEFQLNGDGENESWEISIFKPKMEKSEKISTFNK